MNSIVTILPGSGRESERARERESEQPRQPAAMGIPMRRFSTRANRLLFNLRGAGTVAFNLLYIHLSRVNERGTHSVFVFT